MTQSGQPLAITNMPLHLYLCELPPGRFCWLSGPGASALSLLYLEGVEPVTRIPRLAWLIGAGNERIDETMVCDHRDGLLVTCHGGPAVRRRVEEVLRGAGFQTGQAQPYGGNRFERLTLGLLPQAQGVAAVAVTLEAAGQRRALADLRPNAVARLLVDSAGAAFLFSPPRVQIWGPVNAGKSSLLNALCGQPLAAAGDEPGLTRDVIEGRLEHNGFVLRIFDAPGTWAGVSELDTEAQRLALHWRDRADLVVSLPGGSTRVAEFSGEKLAYDVAGPVSLAAIKYALVEHFFGTLRRLLPERRFALHPELREDLRTMSVDAVRKKWL
jgi:hypothetical protein